MSDRAAERSAGGTAASVREAPSSVLTPVVVDLDFTLVRTDTLVESILKLVKRSPLSVFPILAWLLRGRAVLKAEVARHVALATGLLPFDMELVAFLRGYRAAGHRLVLATAADEVVARRVADHLGLFDDVIASDGRRNLKGRHKLTAIRTLCGDTFIYAGDSRSDLPVWLAAESAVLVRVGPGVAAAVAERVPVLHAFPRQLARAALWSRALRVHQWSKNALLFVPLLTSFDFVDARPVGQAVMAFASFSLAASGTYILNDLWDLESDRNHPRKCRRPFASGALPVTGGLAAAVLLLGLAMLLAWTLSSAFVAMLLCYVVVTTGYSTVVKAYVLMDVILLALLYTYRILAGAAAIDVGTSTWLLAFSLFIFLSLALVKRCSELLSLHEAGVPAATGRDYQVSDLTVLYPFGIGAALSAVVVFGLFIAAPETQFRYATPQLLWVVAVGLIYWLARLWIKTSRGEMHDDPLLFAARDRGSFVVLSGMVAVTIAAHFLKLGRL